MGFNTEMQQINRGQKKTTQKARGLLKQQNSQGRPYTEAGLTQLSGEQMMQGEQCSGESGRECV